MRLGLSVAGVYVLLFLILSTARLCPLLVDTPQHGRMSCSNPYSPFSYGSQCDFECEEGFSLRGQPAVTCNSSGHWSQDLPTCQCEYPHYPRATSFLVIICSYGSFTISVVNSYFHQWCFFPVNQCAPIQASSLLSMNCSHPLGNFSFGSQCFFTCKDGFSLNGTAVLLCSSTGFWSDSLPTCTGKSAFVTKLVFSYLQSYLGLKHHIFGNLYIFLWQPGQRELPCCCTLVSGQPLLSS